VSLLRHVGALVLGAVVAVAAVDVHRWLFPLGLLLAVGTTYAVPLRLLASRWPRLASSYSLGWLAVFAFVIAGRPEGDYAIASDVRGYTLMAAALGLVLVAIVGFTKDPSHTA
jgi:hypothetical protein